VPSTATNREIEIKLRVTDLTAIVRRLQKLGASTLGRVLEQNTLFDTAQSDLRRGGCLLRLRVQTPAGSSLVPPGRSRTVLTSKAPPGRGSHRAVRKAGKPRYKERLEREMTIGLPRVWGAKLEKLGFRSGFHYEKHRTSLRLPGVHVDLDETPVGNFLELEGIPGAIEKVARALGYARRDYLRTTYWDVYAADCRRRGRAPGNMVFDK
jgi:adenylate cyclase, class 2